MLARMRPLALVGLVAIIVLSSHPFLTASSEPQGAHIFGFVLDARDGSPIPGATVLIWDLSDPSVPPHLGAGLYMTGPDGSYAAQYPYIRVGQIYRIYAFRGNRPSGPFDYVPAQPVTITLENEDQQVSFRLLQGACLNLQGDILYVEASSTPYKTTITVIDPHTGKSPSLYNANYIATYWSSAEAWFLGLNERLVIIPSGLRIALRADSRFIVDSSIKSVSFFIDNRTEYFNLKEGSVANVSIWEYPLRKDLEIVRAAQVKGLVRVEDASRSGFIVFEERRRMDVAGQRLLESQTLVSHDPLQSWYIMREVYAEIQGVGKTLDFMKLAASSEAIRLPIFLSVLAVTLGFFAFEDDKRKLVSSVGFYVLLLITTYLIYPGVSTFTAVDVAYMMLSSCISISAMLTITFGVPKVWREPEVEGEVSLRNATSIIFSISKREVKRRKNRSVFTLLSLCIMVMTFTALTSFGTVYGLTHDTKQTEGQISGSIIRRGNDSSMFVTIPPMDIVMLQNTNELMYISPKVESFGDTQPLGDMVANSEGSSVKFYGALGIDAKNESLYVEPKIRISGRLPQRDDEIIISSSMAHLLNVGLGDNLTIFVRGLGVPLNTVTVVGVFDESALESTTDIDGRNFVPMRLVEQDGSLKSVQCNASDVFMMDWMSLMDLQSKIESLQPNSGIQLAAITRVAFTLKEGSDLESVIRRLTFALGYTVEIISHGRLDTYSLGYFYEAKGAAEMVIPILMVVLNVGAIMLNAVYERQNEMKTLTLLGLNPVQVGSTFVAEAIVVGLLGGGIGYILGLGFQRLMVVFGRDLMVRSKIEWWWSFVGLLLSLFISVLSSLRAASLAIRIYTPSMVKRIKLTREDKEKRKIEVYKVFQQREIAMPVRLLPVEVDFFTSCVINHLRDVKGIEEMIEDLSEGPFEELPDGGKQKNVMFTYYNIIGGERLGTRNKLMAISDPKNEYFRISLLYEPTRPGIPESIVDRTIDLVRDICYSWVKEKHKVVVGFR